MSEAEILGSVGLVYPGGQPKAMRDHADNWQQLAKYLEEQHEQLEALLSRSRGHWQGDAAGTFSAEVKAMGDASSQAAEISKQLAAAQLKHADQHEKVLEVLKELAILIATTLAYIAAASLFPPLLEMARIQLALLVSTAGQVIRILAEGLSVLVRFLVRAQQAIEGFSQLAVRTGGFKFGYGRLLVEGTRDFSIDLTANATVAAIRNKPLSAEQLLTSAAVSFGVGGVIGGLEASGVKKVMDDAGAVKRGADGKPALLSFGEQYRGAVKSLGRRPSISSQGTEQSVPPLTGPWAEYADAHASAQAQRVNGSTAEQRRLTEDQAAAQRAYSQRDERYSHAQDLKRKAEEHEHRASGLLASAEKDLHNRQTQHDAYRASGNAQLIRDAEQQISVAQAAVLARRRELENVQAAHRRAQHELVEKIASKDSAAERLRTVEERAAVSRRLSESADRVRTETTLGQRLGHTWRNNEWRQTFGATQGWREILLFDSVKDFVKGVSNSAALGGINAAKGEKSAGDIWKDALLGGATGAVRGALKGSFNNVAFPAGGVEEIMWKVGTKTLDVYTREQVKPLMASEQSGKVAVATEPEVAQPESTA